MIAQQAPVPLIGQTIGGAIGAVLAVSLCVLAWRSSVDDWRAFNQRWRPKSWRSWPIYSVFWHHMDEHTAPYLWFTRIILLLAATFIGIGCGYALTQLVGLPI